MRIWGFSGKSPRPGEGRFPGYMDLIQKCFAGVPSSRSLSRLSPSVSNRQIFPGFTLRLSICLSIARGNTRHTDHANKHVNSASFQYLIKWTGSHDYYRIGCHYRVAEVRFAELFTRGKVCPPFFFFFFFCYTCFRVSSLHCIRSGYVYAHACTARKF